MTLKGEKAIKAAVKAGCAVRNGHGSHVVVEAPAGRGYMTLYRGELSKGVEHSVRKWFAALGIALALACLLVVFL